MKKVENKVVEYTTQLEISGIQAKNQEEAVEKFWQIVAEDRNLLSTMVWEIEE